MRYRRFQPADYIVYGLAVIGFLHRFIQNPAPFLIPLLVFGAIFLLYKYPPNVLKRSMRRRTPPPRYSRSKPPKTVKAKFRVIRGSKDDSSDQSPPPRYH